MNPVDIILKKKNGRRLDRDELAYMVEGYTYGDVPDYQMSAFLMAVCFNGLNDDETVELTRIMKNSGDVADLSRIDGIKIDKHSTGGVGDKTTLILSPIVAACGVPVAKMSGRGLGFTGGTIDKLEAIPGFKTSIEEEDFYRLVNENHIAVIGQTAHIAPADKKIYALRDVTGTVDDLSLITSSIMSKKLASGSDGIVLDVKCGRGAFMKSEEDAVRLAESMVRIGRAEGKYMAALITDMDQPLGKTVGNSVEVRESIDVLKGRGPHDITEVSINLAGHMIYMGKGADSLEEGIEKARSTLDSGKALEKFRSFISGQGGDVNIVDDEALLPMSPIKREIRAEDEGYVISLDAMLIGEASGLTGAGRLRKEDEIDHGAGIVLEKKVGDRVSKGDVLCILYSSDEHKLAQASKKAAEAYKTGKSAPEMRPLIHRVIRKEDEII